MALAFALIVPAGYFAIAYATLNHELSFAANLKANRLAKYIYANQQLWQYQTHRLSQLIEVPEADESEMRQRIFDADGKLVFEAGAQPSPPVATSRVPLVVSGMTVGSIETAASMRGLMTATALVGLLSGLLGFSAFFVLRLVPLRIIDRALAELETMQARYRLLFDASPFFTIVVDRRTLRLLDANETAVRQYGWSREELLAMSSNDFYPPEDLPAVIAARERFMADPAHIVPPLRHRKKDGTIIDVEQTVHPIEYRGQPALLVTANDVTARNRVLKELRESEHKYQALVEALPVGILESTTDGRIVTANAAWRRMFGFSRRRGSQQGRRPDALCRARRSPGGDRGAADRCCATGRRGGVPSARRDAVPGRALPQDRAQRPRARSWRCAASSSISRSASRSRPSFSRR